MAFSLFAVWGQNKKTSFLIEDEVFQLIFCDGQPKNKTPKVIPNAMIIYTGAKIEVDSSK